MFQPLKGFYNSCKTLLPTSNRLENIHDAKLLQPITACDESKIKTFQTFLQVETV